MPATLRCVIFPAGLDATADLYARVFAELAELFGVARSTSTAPENAPWELRRPDATSPSTRGSRGLTSSVIVRQREVQAQSLIDGGHKWGRYAADQLADFRE